MSIYLVSISGEPVAEFEVPLLDGVTLPDVIVWQTRSFQWCERAMTGEIYEEANTYFMPPQFEVPRSTHAVLENVKERLDP